MKNPTPQIPAPTGAPPMRPETPIAAGPAPRRRKRSTLVLGVLVTLVGVLGTSMLVRSAGDRVDVLAVARDVPAGQQITAADLTTAALPEDPAISPVKASEKDSIIGRRATAPLHRGELLADSQVHGGKALPEGQDLVAVEVQRGAAPADALAPGDQVKVVSTPGKDESISKGAAPDELRAQVVKVGSPNASGAVVVQVAVTSADGAQLAARAATGRVAIVLAAKG
ncbi:SAF domain-containing protein [Streptomyces pinistramenti]|uniref:SAF domain-containing protein n=1 Tax=Streptomyces pinistramenti TaxID=2884812 RepID=UPI001D0838E7|nr:SAF domain-containing protein [Streptomyces pinistramenti]MCB5910386.1 SAF domain-containing protein [Streptomyces pinistramenti]